MHKLITQSEPSTTRSINLHALGQTASSAHANLHRLLDSQLLELTYQSTSNTDVFALLDKSGHYCVDASRQPPALLLFANKIDATLAKDILNTSQQHHYAVYHCRLDKHPRMTHYTVGQALFALINSRKTLQLTQSMVCVGYLSQQLNGQQRFVTQHHENLPDVCFMPVNNQVLLSGFPLRDYFSGLFTTYDGNDAIIKSMIAKLAEINLLSDAHVLKQRVSTLRTFLTHQLSPFNPSLPSAPQAVL